jgi:hypothetical protein
MNTGSLFLTVYRGPIFFYRLQMKFKQSDPQQNESQYNSEF